MTAGRASRLPVPGRSLLQLIRPAILLLVAVLAPPAAAATLEEQAASAAVLEEEAVDHTVNSSVLLSPQAAAEPGAPSTQVVAATQLVGGDPSTVAWRTTGGGSWTALSGITPAGTSTRGAADVTWGVGNDVWIAHVAEDNGNGVCHADSGIFLSRSTNDGVSFTTPSSPYAPNRPDATPAFTWEDARVAMDRDDQNQPVSPFIVGGVTKYTSSTCATPSGHMVGIAGGTGSTDPIFIDNARWPSMVSLSDHRAVIAYYSESLNRIVVRRYKVGSSFPFLWETDSAAAILPGVPAQAAGGVTFPAAPDIALGPDGRLHIAYAVTNGSDTDVVYAFSTDEGSTWTAPVSVADPGAAGANQYLPAIAVAPTTSATIPGGRAEVVYLDSRDGGYRPFLTAFAQFVGDGGPTRGANRPLDPAAHQPVSGTNVGNRLAVLATPGEVGVAPGGPAFAWWPNTNNGTSDPVKLYRSRVNHGAEAPVLPNGTVGTSKNVAVAIPDLFAATDGDGDPVRVSLIAAPAHGSLQGTTFTPSPGYAGADVMTLLADDGQPRGGTQRQIVVANAAPVLPDVKTALRVPQGGSASLQLKATDADPGDQLRYELVLPLPSQLANGVVTVSDGGMLTVRTSKTARSTSILDVRVRVVDTSPLVGGTREALVPVKIDPQYVPFTVQATFTGARNTARFAAEIEDEDQERGSRTPTYDWDWGDNTTHGVKASDRHTYQHPGVYNWSVTVTIPRAEQSVSYKKSGTIEVTEAGIKVLRLKQFKVSKTAKKVTIKLRSQVPGTVRLRLLAGRRRSHPARRVKLVARRTCRSRCPPVP